MGADGEFATGFIEHSHRVPIQFNERAQITPHRNFRRAVTTHASALRVLRFVPRAAAADVVVFIHLQFHPYTTIFHAQPKTLTSVHVPLQRVHSLCCCCCCRRSASAGNHCHFNLVEPFFFIAVFLFCFRCCCFALCQCICVSFIGSIVRAVRPVRTPEQNVAGMNDRTRKNSAHSVTTIEFRSLEFFLFSRTRHSTEVNKNMNSDCFALCETTSVPKQ